VACSPPITSYGFNSDPQKGIITVGKLQENVSITPNECDAQIQSWGGIYYPGGIALASQDASAYKSAIVPPSGSPGIGGSMARFTIVNHYLYGLDGTNLDVVDISTETNPVADSSIQVNWDAQTLFPYNDHLFVGEGRECTFLISVHPTSQR